MKTILVHALATVALAALAHAQPAPLAPSTSANVTITSPANITTPAAAAAPLDLLPYKLQTVYTNNFSKPEIIAREEDFIEQAANGTWHRTARPGDDAEWIAEGTGGVEVRDGQLRVAPSPFDDKGQPTPVPDAQRSNMVVWNHFVFPANFLLEYDMSPNGSTGGLTIVLFCASGKNGEDLFDLSLPPRRADYPAYHSGAIANYTDAYWSRNIDPPDEALTNRLRKNPGFQEVASGPSFTTGPTDVTYHVRLLKVGAHVAVEINGHVAFQWDDPDKPLGAGRIGFRSMSGVTIISYSHLKVSQVIPKTVQKKS